MVSKLFLGIALILSSASTLAAPPRAATGLAGTWRNGSDSVRIRVAPCGPGMCGTVIRASEKARNDAARGGTDELVGTELFHDFRRDDDGLWYGEVYVPDIGQTFQGTIELTDRDTLVGSGCLFAGIGCKSQTWRRVR